MIRTGMKPTLTQSACVAHVGERREDGPGVRLVLLHQLGGAICVSISSMSLRSAYSSHSPSGTITSLPLAAAPSARRRGCTSARKRAGFVVAHFGVA